MEDIPQASAKTQFTTHKNKSKAFKNRSDSKKPAYKLTSKKKSLLKKRMNCESNVVFELD